MTMTVIEQRNHWLANSELETIKLEDLTVVSEYQMRVKGEDTTYAEKLLELCKDGHADNLPAVDVMEIDGKRFLVDGFHRVSAMRKAKISEISANIMKGRSSQDAVRYAITSNDTHGLNASSEDMASAIKTALEIDKDTFTNGYKFDTKGFAQHYGFRSTSAKKHTKEYRDSLKTARNDQIRTLDSDGLTQREIAQQVMIDQSTVSAMLENDGKGQSAQIHQLGPLIEAARNARSKSHSNGDDDYKLEPMTNEHFSRHLSHITDCISWHHNQNLTPEKFAEHAASELRMGNSSVANDGVIVSEFFTRFIASLKEHLNDDLPKNTMESLFGETVS